MILGGVALLVAGLVFAGEPDPAAYQQVVPQFFGKYCVECHGAGKQEADLDLERLHGTEEEAEWLDRMISVLEFEEMPPAKRPQPEGTQRAEVIDLLAARLKQLEEADPNDPGELIMARLNQSEYDHVIRDLTGHDLKPARFFASDQEGENGFINVGEVLGMEPVRIQNYLMGAKWVLRHGLATPNRGMIWYPQQIDAGDEERLAGHYLQELADWHARWEAWALGDVWSPSAPDPVENAPSNHEQTLRILNLADYFFAAWQQEHREGLGLGKADFESLGEEASEFYRPYIAERWHGLLTNREAPNHLLERVIELWQQIPGPDRIDSSEARTRCQALADWYGACLFPHDWFDRNGIARRGQVRHQQIQPAYETTKAFEPIAGQFGTQREVGFTEESLDFMERARYHAELDLTKFPGETLYWVITDYWNGSRGDLVEIRDAAWEIDGAWQTFELPGGAEFAAPQVVALPKPENATRCRFTVQLSEADRKHGSVQVMVLPREPEGHERHFLPGRQLIAWPEALGFRNKRKATEVTCFEHFAARASAGNRDTGFRSVVLAEDGFSPAQEEQLGLRQLQPSVSPYHLVGRKLESLVPREAVAERKAIVADLRALLEGEPPRDAVAQEILQEILPQLWRRPVPPETEEFFLEEYRRAVAEGAPFDAAVKRPLTMALVSPEFLFKNEALAEPGSVRPLDDFELANRLAFFLWSSMPDERLFALAEAGRLSDPDVLVGEMQRMLEDERGRALATELAGRWLGFFRFDEFDQPDMETFPSYTETLRAAMYEESTRFFYDLFRENRPLQELVSAPYVYANAELAAHYGLEGVEGDEVRQVALTPAQQAQRGGLFGMGSLLTLTSSPVRTSPIHRGVWLIDAVLGTPTPDPPPGITALSEGEKSHEGLNIRQQLAQHREDPVCSSCHDRIDPPGLALEAYDAIGRWRSHDSDGSPIDASGVLSDGTVLDGIEGLRAYVLERMPDLEAQFVRKLAGFALGRYLTVNDRLLQREMIEAMRADGGRPLAALEVLVRSPQFQSRREPDAPPVQLGKLEIDEP